MINLHERMLPTSALWLEKYTFRKKMLSGFWCILNPTNDACRQPFFAFKIYVPVSNLHFNCARLLSCTLFLSVDLIWWQLPTFNTPGFKYEPAHDKTYKMACAPIEDSDQPGHPPSLIRVFAVRTKKSWVFSYPLSAKRRLNRLGECPGGSESSQGAYAIL